MDPRAGPAAVVVTTDDEDVVWTLDAAARLDLAAVDLLARLQLEARRRGWTVTVRNPSPRLRALLDLAGLLEVIGEPEGREQLGVQEVVDPGDPAT